MDKTFYQITQILILCLLVHNTDSWCLYKTYHELAGSQINQVDWSPDGNYIVVASSSKRATVFNFQNSNVVWFNNFTNIVKTAKFNKKGNWLAIGLTGDDTVHIYNVPAFTLNISASARHTGAGTGVNQLDFSYDDTKMVTCGEDGFVNERNTNSLGSSATSFKTLLRNTAQAISCKYSELNQIGSSSTEGKLNLHQINGNIQASKSFTYSKDIDFRPKTNRYIYGGCTCSTKIHEYDIVDDTIRDFIDTGFGQIWSVSHSPDQKFLAAGGQNGYFYILNTTNRSSPFFQSRFKNSSAHINSVRVSDNSNFVAVAQNDGIINIYARNCKACPMGHYFNQTICRLCTLDIVGCAICKNSTYCNSCFSAYFLNSTQLCQICSSNIPGCQTCKSNLSCINCLSTHFLSGTICKPCNNITSNCEQCFSNSTCIKCSYYYYLNSLNTCSLCKQSIQNCLTCRYQANASSLTGSTLNCIQCSQGYFSFQSICKACHISCLQCLNDQTCIACKQQFKLNGSSCISCGANCQSCLENGTCIDCIPTTILQSGSCNKCVSPCLTCKISPLLCESCIIGYYKSGSNICSKCASNCSLCNPINGNCLQCPQGYYLSSPNICSRCLNLTSHCSICTAIGCLLCERNYYLFGSTCLRSNSISNCDIYQKNSNSKCDSCSLGYFLASSGSCLKCQQNCLICQNSSYCSSCMLGFYSTFSNQTCLQCLNPCKTCIDQNSCLSCGDKHYLEGIQCKRCQFAIPFCHSCINKTTCLNCFLGYVISSNMSCIPCISPCSTCDLNGCLSCQLGYYLQLNNCVLCPLGCSTCMFPLTCTQCVSGYLLNGSFCIPCDNLYPLCEQCSSAQCLVCKSHHFLNSSSLCSPCLDSIPFCLQCNQLLSCEMCISGYYVTSNGLSCSNCYDNILNCQKCSNGTICDKCIEGFFFSSLKICQKCPEGCQLCSPSGVCEVCQIGYVKTGSSTCQLCSQFVFGCKMCTVLNNCLNCSLGYYLQSPTNCILCKKQLQGCISCNTNTQCYSCEEGYFLNSSKKCERCPSQGCAICTLSNFFCQSCFSGYYMKNTSLCQACHILHPYCIICNQTSCLSCQSGFFLQNETCHMCNQRFQDCIICDQSSCLQCSQSKYLSFSNNCLTCNLDGCQICSQDGNSCLQCSNIYYKVGLNCSLCSLMNEGCLSCQGINDCKLCHKNYYLQIDGKCKLCSQKFKGCDICSRQKCSSCQSNFFYNTSTSNGSCQLCKAFIPGCELCVNQHQCLVCQITYYLANNSCKPCSDINKCYICNDSSTCMLCGQGYYLKNNQCYPCSESIIGCLSCVSQNLCSICSGNYRLFEDECIQITQVSSSSSTLNELEQIRLISEFVNITCLKHTLYSKWQFRKIQQQWNQVTKIQLTQNNNNTLLNIQNVVWQQYSLIFETNNPYGDIQSSGRKGMPFIAQFSRRRLLFSLFDFSIKTNFQLSRQAVGQILPQLETGGNLVLSYKLNEPEFYKSIIVHQRYYFYVFGLSVIVVLIFVYLVKICLVIPSTSDSGQIIPHILMMKIPAMVLYPSLGGYIDFCYGFTFLDIPWTNNYFSKILSNQWEKSPSSFQLYYKNLNLSSTYLLPLVVFLIIYIPLSLYSYYKNKKQTVEGTNKVTDRKKEDQLESEQTARKIQIFRGKKQKVVVFKSFIYNIFITGLTVSSFSNFIGIFFNYTSIITLSGVFYLLGIIVYMVIVVDAITQFKESIRKIRIVLKATLMTLTFLSPIPLLAVVVTLDIFMIVYEHKQKVKVQISPKISILSYLLLLIAYSSLILLSNMLLGIVISSCCIIAVLGFDGFIQYSEYLQIAKIYDIKDERYIKENNLTVEEIVPKYTDQLVVIEQKDIQEQQEKGQQKKKNIRKDTQQYKVNHLTAVSQSRLMKSQQVKFYP